MVFGNIDSLEILSHYISERAILEFPLWSLRQVGLPAFHHGGLGLFTLVSIVIIISLVITNSIISLAIISFVVVNQQQLQLLLNQSVILPYKDFKKILSWKSNASLRLTITSTAVDTIMCHCRYGGNQNRNKAIKDILNQMNKLKIGSQNLHGNQGHWVWSPARRNDLLRPLFTIEDCLQGRDQLLLVFKRPFLKGVAKSEICSCICCQDLHIVSLWVAHCNVLARSEVSLRKYYSSTKAVWCSWSPVAGSVGGLCVADCGWVWRRLCPGFPSECPASLWLPLQ